MRRISDYEFLDLNTVQGFVQIAQLVDNSGLILCVDFCLNTNQIAILETPINGRVPVRYIRNSHGSELLTIYEIVEILGYDQMIVDYDAEFPMQIRCI